MSSMKKVSQKDLRQMMKERKELQTQQTAQSGEVSEHKTIDSPLVRLDSKGRMCCIVCEESISSATLWSQHIVSKSHKNKIEEMKRKKLNSKAIQSKSNNKTNQTIDPKVDEMKPILKRKLETNSVEISSKLSKTSSEIKTKDINKDSNNGMEDNDNMEMTSSPISCELQSVIPNDFFDETKHIFKEINESKDSEMETNCESNSLPKGFFDDPVMDAKARKVVFKDPIDEQWEQFQKVIAEETHVSQNIIEEDNEEIHFDKGLEEIEEQIANWVKVNEMQKKAEILHNFIKTNESNRVKEEESSDSDVDEQELNVFSDWRSRTALNSK